MRSLIDPWVYYWASVAVLAVLLFLPVSRLIWALSVHLSDAERAGQRNWARFLAALLCAAFSALFNFQILGMARLG